MLSRRILLILAGCATAVLVGCGESTDDSAGSEPATTTTTAAPLTVSVATTAAPVVLTPSTLPRTPNLDAWCVGFSAPLEQEMGLAAAEDNARDALQRAAEVLATAPEEIVEDAELDYELGVEFALAEYADAYGDRNAFIEYEQSVTDEQLEATDRLFEFYTENCT